MGADYSHLAAGDIFGDESHFRCALRPWSDLPNLCLQRIARFHGGCEPDPKVLESLGVISTHNLDNRTCGESKGGQTM